jgi:RNA polymerase sigma-70 factor (ECF subfamily)
MDEDLQELVVRGRYPEAFELLLARYQNKVFRLAYSILGNETLAEEAAQDIFVRVWKALPLYNGQASLSTWLYAISRNACLSARRQQAARRESPLEETAEPQSSDRVMQIDVPALLARLPDVYRRVLTLFYLEEKSYQEVAQMLDLPMGTVKTHLHRARKEAAALLASRR